MESRSSQLSILNSPKHMNQQCSNMASYLCNILGYIATWKISVAWRDFHSGRYINTCIPAILALILKDPGADSWDGTKIATWKVFQDRWESLCQTLLQVSIFVSSWLSTPGSPRMTNPVLKMVRVWVTKINVCIYVWSCAEQFSNCIWRRRTHTNHVVYENQSHGYQSMSFEFTVWPPCWTRYLEHFTLTSCESKWRQVALGMSVCESNTLNWSMN